MTAEEVVELRFGDLLLLKADDPLVVAYLRPAHASEGGIPGHWLVGLRGAPYQGRTVKWVVGMKEWRKVESLKPSRS